MAKEKYGLELNKGIDRLTNVRFADDLLLMARSRQQVANMLKYLSSEAENIGM